MSLGKKKTTKKGGKSPGAHKRGPVLDGFNTLIEAPPLVVKDENIAPYTMPAEAFAFTPEPEAIICKFKNGDKERKIYCNIELEDAEKESLKKLQEEAMAQGLAFLPSIAIMAGRFLSRARGDASKAIKLMEATQEWRLDYFQGGPVVDTELLEDLAHGIVYFSGRDKSLRPVIVVRATRIPSQWYKERRVDKLIRVLIFCMEYLIRYMLVPGAIENLSVIVDLKGLGITQVPISALSEVYKVMSHHYIGRVFKFYACNLSGTLSTIAGMVKGLLTDRQKQKLNILDSVSELLKDYNANQLEEDLGGSRPVLTSFYPFPIQAGPYTDTPAGEGKASIPGAHVVLSEKGARGALWDLEKTPQENTALIYSAEAFNFFTTNELLVPDECRRQHEERLRAEAEAAESAKQSQHGQDPAGENQAPDSGNVPLPSEEEEEEEGDTEVSQAGEDEVVVQSVAVKPNGLFSCGLCWCSQ